MNFWDYFNNATVLITGASSGLGEEFARQLAPRASRLILVARRLDRLDALKQEFTSRFRQLQVEIHRVDLANPEDREAFCREMTLTGSSIDLLINNAGLGDIGRFQSAEWPRIESMLEVNIAALTTITRTVLPLLQKKGKGAILNVSSISAIFPVPRLAVYAATKAYVGSFSESLRVELRGTGVTVTSVCPGPVDTGFGEVASRKKTKDLPVPGWLKAPATKVVSDALRAVSRDQARLFPGWRIQALAQLIAFTPLPALRRLLPLYLK